ncbi:MAG: cytochrome b/b6 domain-containing protein [Terricaulis silvestris]
MSATNTKQSYGWVTIALHWLAALGVLAMLYIGLSAGWAEDAGDKTQHRALMTLHVALGSALVAFLFIRIVWHYTQKRPELPANHPLLNMVGNITQNLLLIAVLILIISGPMMIWSAGRPINFAGVWPIPSPFAERNREVHELFEKAHTVGRYALYALIPLHLLGGLKHLIIDRDGVFQRMLGAKRAA